MYRQGILPALLDQLSHPSWGHKGSSSCCTSWLHRRGMEEKGDTALLHKSSSSCNRQRGRGSEQRAGVYVLSILILTPWLEYGKPWVSVAIYSQKTSEAEAGGIRRNQKDAGIGQRKEQFLYSWMTRPSMTDIESVLHFHKRGKHSAASYNAHSVLQKRIDKK